MLQFARLPVFRQIIIVGVVLEGAAGGAVDVPEVGRGDRVATGTDESAPGIFVHRDAAADHLVNIADGESNMIQPALTVRQLQQEEVVMATARAAAQEDRAVNVAV